MSVQVTAVRKEDEASLNRALREARGKAIMAAVLDGTVKRLKLGPE